MKCCYLDLCFIGLVHYVMVNPGQIINDNEDLQLSEKDNETLCNILDKNISETNRKQILNLAKRRLLIESLVPKNNSELSSEESTRFSHLVSTTVPNYTISRQERYQDILTKFESVAINDHDYCYACSKMYPFIKNIREFTVKCIFF
ncbi:hypothetical protein NQ317_013800 [Molorchus minor]|uniref:Uncharacterized protein n=1 Tax=Molorchus minor TaxID=1323400 RepID=A0ABQ9J590_9CUCU|nr:hypothetical protein NQ317_013800 [Molorchus minor]